MDLVNFLSDPLFSNPLAEFDHLFDRAFARGPSTAPNTQPQSPHVASTPCLLRSTSVEVHEDKEKNLVSAAFQPEGCQNQGVNTDLQHGVLAASGGSKAESRKEESEFHLGERRFGRFSEMEMDNGVLTIVYPRQLHVQKFKKTTTP
ncbi:HSP20-like chaperone [Trametes polyzona]|nr:HSP20-like chaperone [Trametes polyzona]